MNFATKDIRYNLGRFALTAVGIGLLLMIILGMIDINRWRIADALVVVNRVGADVSAVQRGSWRTAKELECSSRTLRLQFR